MTVNIDKSLLLAVRGAYSHVAEDPEGEHPFPVGREFAESLGYPSELLNSLPPIAVDAFSGVLNLSLAAEVDEGSTVLDLGCGAGLDSLVLGRRVGTTGRVMGIDFSESMIKRAQKSLESSGASVGFVRAAAESLPLATESIDSALVNGIFNLNPHREALFEELARVLRPGGRGLLSRAHINGSAA